MQSTVDKALNERDQDRLALATCGSGTSRRARMSLSRYYGDG